MELKKDAEGRLVLFGQAFNAQQLDHLLHQVAQARGDMRPPVAEDSAEFEDSFPITIQIDPTIELRIDEDGLVELAYRHNGFGWLGFALSLRNAALLRDKLAELAPQNVPHAGTAGTDSAH